MMNMKSNASLTNRRLMQVCLLGIVMLLGACTTVESNASRPTVNGTETTGGGHEKASHYDEISSVPQTDPTTTIVLAGEDVGFYEMIWNVNDFPGDCDFNAITLHSLRTPYGSGSVQLQGRIPWPQSESVPEGAEVKSFVRHECGSSKIADATLAIDHFSESGLLYADTRRLHLVGEITVEVLEQLTEPERARLRITFSNLEHDPDQPHPDWVQAADDFTDDVVIEGEFLIRHYVVDNSLPPETVIVPAP